MCGLEALMLALKLATELVQPSSSWYPDMIVDASCSGCRCVQGSAWHRCQAEKVEREAEEIRIHNAKVKEFQAIVKMCKIP